MCLAIPGRVMEIKDDHAKVDFGGVIRDVNVSLVQANLGEYVIVHAGFAIQVMDEKNAKETIDLWNEMLSEK